MTEGRCLCGAVRVRVETPLAEISACFCDLCRRWGGGVQMGIAVDETAVAIMGPVKRHRSSKLAERAWCDTCGSALWFRYLDGSAHFELAPGLFENAGGARLIRVNYADRAPAGYDLAGDVERVSAAAYARRHPVVEEGER